jgi:hypothetical protein
MTIEQLVKQLEYEVSRGLSIAKERSLYKEASLDVKNNIKTSIEKQVVCRILQDRMFINDCNVDEVDFEISDESISEMVTYAMVDNFSVFNRK